MSNPNHDPKTGEFSSGDGGSAGAHHGRIDQSRGLTPGAGNGGTAGMHPMKADELKHSFDSHMAEASKNIAALNRSSAGRASDRQKFNSAAQKMFGSKTKVRL